MLVGDLPWYVSVLSQSCFSTFPDYFNTLSLHGHWDYLSYSRLTPISRAITSLAITLPSVYYLMQPQIDRYQHPEKYGRGGHGGHGGHEEHDEEGKVDEEGGSSEDGESGDEKIEDQGPGGEEASKGETEEGSSEDSGTQGEENGTPDTSDDEGSENTAHVVESGKNVEGVQFKGASSAGTSDGGQDDTRKLIPDAKGGNKKRIESHYGGKEGEAQEPEQDPRNKDLVSIAPHARSWRKGRSANIG